jgi:alkanesulfonate monooxygenase SsuD/methylene tetrahydromethanopterin reductase-like flavin-dependent oxidoreductase (luciferase family)
LQTPEETGATVQAIRDESKRIGRPIPDDHYGATILFRIGDPPDTPRRSGHKSAAASISEEAARTKRKLERIQAIGDPEKVLALIREFRAVGVTKFIAVPIAQNAKEMMEQTRLLDEEVLPHAGD